MKASGSDFSDVKIFYPVDSILSEEISEKIGSIESFYRETIARTDLSSDELERIFSYEDWIRSRLAEPENMPEHLFLRLEEIQTSRVIPLLARAKGFLFSRKKRSSKFRSIVSVRNRDDRELSRQSIVSFSA